MANLKEIKTRIATVASTQQTTSAMKLISASKLRKAQLILLKLRPFSDKLHRIMLQTVQDGETNFHSPFLEIRKPEKVLLIVVTSNSGLCGAFNSVVLKTAMNHIKTKYLTNPDVKEISILCFGKKAAEFFAKQPYNVVANYVDFMAHLNYSECNQIVENLLQSYKNHTYDLVDMVSNRFVNAVVYETVVRQKLPYNIKEMAMQDLPPSDHYLYMPNKDSVIHNIIPMSIKVRTYMHLSESFTAEFAARMTSMHKATENAIQLQKELKLRYNKARQAAITNEIIEITNGANALRMGN
ncbi:MAG: ATP synthase F1 subunit gamma [Bacteroidales bacterium]|jgi:F-type H+-transporting ATPase subunit gamma|nr:ATP synthase F1 subunit gamma [Bacteroidales bacterium]